MTTNELRAKFEAWVKYANITFAGVSQLRTVDGYADSYIGALWKGYKAAYASRDAEVEALRKDVDRYRWLRDRVTGTDKKPFICIFHGNFGLWNGEHADREIDAAMREKK